MQPGKNIKILINYFLGPLLFLWLSYSIWHQIERQPHLEASWQSIRSSFGSSRILLLVAALLLIPLNWGLEALKWQRAVVSIQSLSFRHAFMAVLSGVAFSITMPNRVGEYLGRMIFLPEGSRLRTISVTLVCSLAQLLITMFAGCVSLALMQSVLQKSLPAYTAWSGWVLAVSVVLFLVSLVVYFRVSAFSRWPWIGKRYAYLVEALSFFESPILLKLLLISFLRYLVFLLQYVLLFYFFGVDLPPLTLVLVMALVFWVMAIIPSIALVEVWLRGEVLIMLMGIYSSNVLGIGLTSVTVWFINLILPAIAGSLLILSHKIFNKK